MKTIPLIVAIFLGSALHLAGADALPGSAPAGNGRGGRGGPAAAPVGTTVARDLVFTKIGALELSLDLYRPEKFNGKLPVVVWIYGSAWGGGAKEAQASRASWLAQHGYAVAIIDHRGSGVAQWPAQIHDVKAAVRWLRGNAEKFSLDADRFGAYGNSSGGHLSSLLGTTGNVPELEGNGGTPGVSSRVQAVVVLYGPSDFLQMDAHKIAPGGIVHDAPDSPESRLLGGPIQENKAKAAQASPLTYISAETPPFLLIHGDQDNTVPSHQTQLMYDALKASGHDVTYYRIAGAGHGGAAYYNDLTNALVLTFFNRVLQPAPSTGATPAPSGR